MPRRTTHITRFETTQGNLPHWEEPGATYFVTCALRRPPVADLTTRDLGPVVVDALRFSDGQRYALFDYTVMPEHFHMILQPTIERGACESVLRIVYSIKRWSAHQINERLGRAGPVWQTESYDNVIRNHEDYLEKAAYVLDNPRRAGLVTDPTEWPWWGKGLGCGRSNG